MYRYIFFLIFNILISAQTIKPNIYFEDHFGVTIEDPYNYFKNVNDSLFLNWLRNETKETEYVYNKITNRDKLIEKLKQYNQQQNESFSKIKITENLQYFYLKRSKEDKIGKLYYRENFKVKDILLFDPKKYLSNLEREYKINYISPSWDGKKVAIALSYDGKELSDILIIDVVTKDVAPEVITQTWPSSFNGIQWLPDNSGFTYLYFPVVDINDKNFKKNTASVLYKLGTDPNHRKVILSRKTHPELVKTKETFPTTEIQITNKKYIIGYAVKIESYWDVFYTEIENLEKNKIEWKTLHTKEDQIYKSTGYIYENQFIGKSGKKTKNFSIISFPLGNPIDKKIIVKEYSDKVIQDFRPTNKGIFYTTVKNGVESEFFCKKRNETAKKINLPQKSGSVSLDGQSLKKELLFLSTAGWLNDYNDYFFDIDKKEFKERSLSQFKKLDEFKDFVINEIEIPSHDGVLVPLSIIHQKNLNLNQKNPTLIIGYGAYGVTYNPLYEPTNLTFVAEGGVLAIAHVRGGGEKGEAWHKAGQKITKPNTWKDLIACTEYLIEKKYTQPENIALYSMSAGGIMVGRAITERPDLFKVGLVQVGSMNPLHLRSFNKNGHELEFGDPTNEEDFNALVEMDPYLNIRDKGVSYPAMLLTAGINDTRVPAWIPAKFVARLQNSETQNPVLFDVNFKGGHFGGSSDDLYKKWANYFAFILWQTGHPDYQLKKMSK